VTEVTQKALATLRRAPELRVRQGRYQVRFARTQEELDEILRLRFQVFNLELGEGLESSYATRRDEDPFDLACHHLLVEDLTSGRIVGTYRMQTWEMAYAALGFYSAGEFALEALPPEVLFRGVEVGRACIERDHRSRQVLFLLWKGLAGYVSHFGKRYLFGCCSLSTQDPAVGLALYRQLRDGGRVHAGLRVEPRPGVECRLAAGGSTGASTPPPGGGAEEPGAGGAHPPPGEARVPVPVPQLFGTYLRYGALVCGPPAIDRAFKTIDYLVLLDVEALDPRTFRTFFDGEGSPR
jgi:putative hemolysin